MSNTHVVFDSTAIDRTLDALDSEETKRMTFNALKAGGKVLQENATQSMLSKSNWNLNEKQRSNGTRMKTEPAYCEVRVFVNTQLGLHWLESGTTSNRQLKKDHPKDDTHRRTLKKGENRGGIKGVRFFAAARSDEQPIMDAITEKFTSEFEKKVKQYNR